MNVTPIPVLDDNYCYLVKYAPSLYYLVDPAEPDTIMKYLKTLPSTIRITHILTTHKHWDHAGGNEMMLQLLAMSLPSDTPIQILGGSLDDCQAATRQVCDNDTITLGDETITCLLTPGHTNGHICYYSSLGFVFTGDCLFIGGCGKFFEGSPADMLVSMRKLAKLPPATAVYCGHEYTKSNYKFGVSVEPNNQDLLARHEATKDLTCTVPSSIEEEMKSNVFMRCAMLEHNEVKELRTNLGCDEGSEFSEVLGACRKTKDNFR